MSDADEFLNDFLVEANESLEIIDQGLVILEKNPSDSDVLNNIFRAVHTIKGTCGMFSFQRLEHVAHLAEDVLGKMREGVLQPAPATITPILKAIDTIKVIVEGLSKERREIPGDDSVVLAALEALLHGGPERVINPSPPQNAGQESTPTQPSVASPPAVGNSPEQKGDLKQEQQSLRVSIDVLDGLMNLVGELVLTRNQLVQLLRGDDESKYAAPIQMLNRVTSGLQEAVMKTRMQPIGNAWGKLPRIVRDLAQTMGKEIELKMTGQETEIDRQILQAIHDPLIHCVRNSADHGIETPEQRKAKGKPSFGTISLHAFHEGGHIVIEIKDDGAGISLTAVKEKAIEKGLISRAASDQLADSQIFRFIFEPGFSTAKKVTEVSGRGVGMDVVRSNIEKIGGSIDLASEQGNGTTIRIKIPLTLAIISALIVKAGGEQGETFAIPQVGVLELVRISEHNQNLIEEIHECKLLRLREKLLPMLSLGETLGISGAIPKGVEYSVVVAQVGENQFGIAVDEIFDTQEIVVKPVGKLLRDIGLFAGSTILGDGRVVIILDTARIAAESLSDSHQTHKRPAQQEVQAVANGSDQPKGERTTLLLFKGQDTAPLAVPLALVSRLEEFPISKIERVENRFVVQYRGNLLPIYPCQPSIQLEELFQKGLQEVNRQEQTVVPAIIFSDGTRAMGLVVTDVVDIVEEYLQIDAAGKKHGILGASIVSGKATEIVDTYHFLRTAYPDWFEKKQRFTHSKPQILLVDDSSFFRDLLRPILEAHGFLVQVAQDGKQGIAHLEKGEEFDLILSDIEMPNMTGLEMAKRIKDHPLWKKVPLLALTSLAAPPDRQKAIDAGFTDYLVKFDQNMLFETVDRILSRPS